MSLVGVRVSLAFENMSQMAVALRANDFNAHHSVRFVAIDFHRARIASIKRWPAASAVEFALSAVKRIAASSAFEVTGLRKVLVVLANAWSLRSFFTNYVILFGRQLLLPLGVGFDDFGRHC